MKKIFISIFDFFCELFASYHTLQAKNSSDPKKAKTFNRVVGLVVLVFLLFIVVAAVYNNLI